MADPTDTAGSPPPSSPPVINTQIRVAVTETGSVELVIGLSSIAATDLALLLVAAAQHGRRKS